MCTMSLLQENSVSQTKRKFSNIAIDHAHEQLNAVIKGDGGAIGLTDNDTALCRWTVAGPEIVRLLASFESDFFDEEFDVKHHEQTNSIQNRFRADVQRLTEVFDSEVPFSATSGSDVVVLLTHTIAHKSVSDTIRNAKEIGESQFKKFVEERLHKSVDSGGVSVLAPLTKNKLPLFLFKSAVKKQSASSVKLTELKTDCALFSRLYIACQTRDGDLEQFFKHENQAYPPSLSQGGNLRIGSKSDLLDCLETAYSTHDFSDMTVSCYILDGAVIVQMLRPSSNSTFEDYRLKVFFPYVLSLLRKVQRVDIVFDVYNEQSLKLLTRTKRGVWKSNLCLCQN